MVMAYVYDGFLPFYPRFQSRLGDFDVHIAALNVARYGRCEVEVADLLGPFVGKLALLFFLLLFRCLV